MVRHSRDNIFRDVQRAPSKYPTPRSDSTHANLFQFPLGCWCCSIGFCALNRSGWIDSGMIKEWLVVFFVDWIRKGNEGDWNM